MRNEDTLQKLTSMRLNGMSDVGRKKVKVYEEKHHIV